MDIFVAAEQRRGHQPRIGGAVLRGPDIDEDGGFAGPDQAGQLRDGDGIGRRHDVHSE
jgi:hypothetical protein